MQSEPGLLRRLFLSVLQGAAFALGILLFALAMLMAFGSFSLSSMRPFKSEPQPDEMAAAGLTAEQLLISNVREIKPSTSPAQSNCVAKSAQYQYTGTIENTGPDGRSYVNLYADIFDKDGAFIYQCQHQFQETMKKGEKRNFMIDCFGMPDDIAAKYASYKVYTRGEQHW